jgi:hypothetical protein
MPGQRDVDVLQRDGALLVHAEVADRLGEAVRLTTGPWIIALPPQYSMGQSTHAWVIAPGSRWHAT